MVGDRSLSGQACDIDVDMLPAVLLGKLCQEVVCSALQPQTEFDGVDRGAVVQPADALHFVVRQSRFIGIGEEEDDVGPHPQRQA